MSERVYIIAEAGVNHNGDLETALKLVDAAAEAGADAVKFQTFSADRMVTTNAAKADYQKLTTNADESHHEMLKKLELSSDAHAELKRRCDERGIAFLSSPFDGEDVAFLDSLGLETFKVPSGEITNLPYLRSVGALGKSVIMSSGMATLDEICEALDVLEKAGTSRDRVTVLHCTTEYPAPLEEVNLNAMRTVASRCRVRVGYSDHTAGVEVAVAAAALGARVIEKHLTLDRGMYGPDHGASIEPEEFARMVHGIRAVEKALGNAEKTPTAAERRNIAVARKSIVASRNIEKGEILSEDNIAAKRPGGGISPMCWDEVCGTRAVRRFEVGEKIEL